MIQFIYDHFFIIASLLFILAGVTLFLMGMVYAVEAYESKYWPTVAGEVIFSDLLEEKREKSQLQREKRIHPTVCFMYHIDGVEYYSYRINAFLSYSIDWPMVARCKVKKYPKKSIVTVHYPKNRPGEGILEPGLTIEIISLVLAGFVMTILGILATNRLILDSFTTM